VKYHLGMDRSRTYPDGREMHLSLLPNPSHLECVNPLVVGKAKAKMYHGDDPKGDHVLPVIVHGDAAMAGQGVVYETMQLSGVDGWQTGGTINIICNNQVGFTANPTQSRSTMYSSDLGKAFGCPIFHVNADDPEAVVRVFKLATEWRMKWHTDVVVDLIGYRRFGHNEIDEPTFTQPLMYKVIKNQQDVLKIYEAQLAATGAVSAEEIAEVLAGVDKILADAFEASEDFQKPGDYSQGRKWNDIKMPDEHAGRDVSRQSTGAPMDMLKKVGGALTSYPEDFNMHRTLKRQLKAKQDMIDNGAGINWATAEALALGCMLETGTHVRLTGQDVERGTFSHRQCLVHDQVSDENYVFLNGISETQEQLRVYSSPLSEFAVLGYELGYSQETPNQLVIWEAQFGDFVNGAQTIIDQFISSGEAKWLRQSGLVMLLPHASEGQGPEHSSCRLERFLQCSDEDPDEVPGGKDLFTAEGQEKQIQLNNWQIVNCTTPANYFHVLRRQQNREFRKPLIVAAPKSLLRDPQVVSTLDEMGPGTAFRRVIPEAFAGEVNADNSKVRKVVFCSGKVYYDLLAGRRERGLDDVALVRMEQLSPFPFDRVAEETAKYPNATVGWAQEEPKNMGGWYFVQERMMTATRELNDTEMRPSYHGRKTMASPAEGWGDVYKVEQDKLVADALA
jgi:2-oxoglutarate dehydrogenase E1 component